MHSFSSLYHLLHQGRDLHTLYWLWHPWCQLKVLLLFSCSVMSNHLILFLPFSSCLQSFPASGSFLMSQLFASDGQGFGASALASVLPVNIQGWFPLGLIALISLLFMGLSGVSSSTTVWKHQFFGTQLSLWSNSHIRTWLLVKP